MQPSICGCFTREIKWKLHDVISVDGMNQRKRFKFVLFIILILYDNVNLNYSSKIIKGRIKSRTTGQNASEVLRNSHFAPKERHWLVEYKCWQGLSFLGVVGTCSNLLLIHFFYTEPNMATSVNWMIFMETIYRVAYTVTIQWRTFNIVQEETLLSRWFTREKVMVQKSFKD